MTSAHAAQRALPISARSPIERNGHHWRSQARSPPLAGGPGRSAPVAVLTSTSLGPSLVSSATSSGMVSSHSLAITSPVIRDGTDRLQRIWASSPSGRGVISTACGEIRSANEGYPAGGAPGSWPPDSGPRRAKPSIWLSNSPRAAPMSTRSSRAGWPSDTSISRSRASRAAAYRGEAWTEVRKWAAGGSPRA